MKKIETYHGISRRIVPVILAFAATILGACSSTTSTNQAALTHAQMVTTAATCNEIAQNIQAMDKIILDSGMANNNYGYAASQTINSGLAASGVLQKVPGLGVLTASATRSWGSGSTGNSIKYQQGYSAQSEKQRLIGLFQQKQCRLVK